MNNYPQERSNTPKRGASNHIKVIENIISRAQIKLDGFIEREKRVKKAYKAALKEIATKELTPSMIARKIAVKEMTLEKLESDIKSQFNLIAQYQNELADYHRHITHIATIDKKTVFAAMSNKIKPLFKAQVEDNQCYYNLHYAILEQTLHDLWSKKSYNAKAYYRTSLDYLFSNYYADCEKCDVDTSYVKRILREVGLNV